MCVCVRARARARARKRERERERERDFFSVNVTVVKKDIKVEGIRAFIDVILSTFCVDHFISTGARPNFFSKYDFQICDAPSLDN